MPTRSDVLLENLGRLNEDLRALWRGLTRDPETELRKQRAWAALSGAFAAVAAIAARRVATKAWGILTGELPPVGRYAGGPSGSGQNPRQDAAAAPPDPERDHTATPA